MLNNLKIFYSKNHCNLKSAFKRYLMIDDILLNVIKNLSQGLLNTWLNV